MDYWTMLIDDLFSGSTISSIFISHHFFSVESMNHYTYLYTYTNMDDTSILVD